MWTKTGKGRYTATINGRQFTLLHNRRVHSVAAHTPFVVIGRKPRNTHSVTWYNVYERTEAGTIDLTYAGGRAFPPGTLDEAKATAVAAANSEGD